MAQNRFVELTANWADGNALSTIKIGRRIWEKIQAGGSYQKSSWSWSESGREQVVWTFANKMFSIDGEGYRQCVVESPISELG
jgi:hypothetical protein